MEQLEQLITKDEHYINSNIVKEELKAFTKWYNTNLEAYKEVGITLNQMVEYYNTSAKDNKIGMKKALDCSYRSAYTNGDKEE